MLLVDCVWNVMANAQKADFVFRRNGRVHLNRRGRQFSRLLAAEVCASAVVMLDTPCSVVVWRVLATDIRQFPLHFHFRASPCAITFQLESNTKVMVLTGTPCEVWTWDWMWSMELGLNVKYETGTECEVWNWDWMWSMKMGLNVKYETGTECEVWNWDRMWSMKLGLNVKYDTGTECELWNWDWMWSMTLGYITINFRFSQRYFWRI